MGLATTASDGVRWSTRLRRRPVLLFVIVTFLVSYGLGVPALFAAGASSFNDVTKLYVGRFFVVIGPTCGAFTAIAATKGFSAIGPFLSRRLSVSTRQWQLALLLPLMGLAVVFASYVGAGTSLPFLGATLRDAWPLLLAHITLQILVVGMGEELGWRGWLLPSLTNRHGLPRAALLTGIVWYFWHLPILLGGLSDAFWFALAISGLSILLSSLWAKSGQGALLPAIAHGSINAPVVFLTAQLPDAHHATAWKILCGFLAILGLVAVYWTRADWRKAPIGPHVDD